MLLTICPFIFLLYELEFFRKSQFRLVPSLFYLISLVTILIWKNFGLSAFANSELALWSTAAVIYYSYLLSHKNVKREVTRFLVYFTLVSSLNLAGLFNDLSILIVLLIGVAALLFKKGENGLVATILILLTVKSLILKLLNLYGLESLLSQSGESNLLRLYTVSTLLIFSKVLLILFAIRALNNYQKYRFDIDLIVFFTICAVSQFLLRFSTLPLLGEDFQFLIFVSLFLLFWIKSKPNLMSLYLFLALTPNVYAPAVIIILVIWRFFLKWITIRKVLNIIGREVILIIFAIMASYFLIKFPTVPTFALCSMGWVILDELFKKHTLEEAF